MWVFALCALHLVSVAANEKVTVSTLYGSVNGFKYRTEEGNDVNVFLGIPFAKPPLGDLRFERPELPEPWKEPLEATEFAHSCSPHHRSGIPGEHSEDCLYLNVIAPAQESNNPAGHAVMVWIHGGGYCVGTAKTYGYKNISENFATRNIIVVSIQYRLGPLGWASSGDRVMPGNIGYWDQRAAVRFVKENIASFGGDPNRITLFGLSAGGGSASSLSLSPHTRDLFSQTIEMSGSAFAPWAASDSVIESTAALAIALDCPIADSGAMKQCFKSKTTDELFDAVDATGAAQRNLNILKFGPLIDGDFFPYDFERLVEDSPRKPTIIGLVNKESAFFTTEGNLKPINQIRIEPEDYAKYGEKDLAAFINDVVVPEKIFGKQTNELRERLTEHYTNDDAPDDKDYKFYLERYTELVSDAVFNVPCLRMKTSKVANGWPVWFYFNDHHNVGAFSDDAPVKGATHLHEYPYMFGVSPFYNFVVNEEEIKLRTAIVETFAHFAKYGKPGTPEYPWDPVTKERPHRHMRFNPEAKMQEGLLQRTVAFWESLGESGRDIIRGSPRPHGRSEDEL